MVNFEKENSKIKKLIGLFLVCILVLLYALFIYKVDEQESSNRDLLIVVSFFLACICQYFVIKSMRKIIAYKGITDNDNSKSTNNESHLDSAPLRTDFKDEFGNNLEDYDDFYDDDDEDNDNNEFLTNNEDTVKKEKI